MSFELFGALYVYISGHSFDLIKIIRSLKASQNDFQILIFVKAIDVVGEKMTRNSGKIVKF